MLISYVVVEVAVVLQCVAGWSFRPSSTVEKVTCLNRSHLKLVYHLLHVVLQGGVSDQVLQWRRLRV